MNRDDRKRARDALNQIEGARDALAELGEDLQERLDNVQEYFESGPVVDGLEENISELEDISYTIDDLIDAIEGVIG